MKILKVLLVTFFIVIQCLNYNVYAENKESEFEFEQSRYLLRGERDDEVINMLLPTGYTIKDVEITSEDDNIVHVFEFLDKYYMESLEAGKTRLKAVIKDTNYVAYCDVEVEESIIINTTKKDVGKTLEIDNYCPYLWSVDSRQACEIAVTPLKSQGEEKWIRLEQGIAGVALNKKYSYDISENCIVTVRWLAWMDGFYYQGEEEVTRKTMVIDDIEETSTIGAHIKIYANDYKETSATIHKIGDTLKLNTERTEVPNDLPITWKSYQENVAVVDSNGVVTGIQEGVARIEATITGTDYIDVFPVIVQSESRKTIQQLLENKGAVSGVIPNDVTVGSIKQAFIHSEGFELSWDSMDDRIVTITQDGKMQGKANGKTKIGANITYKNASYRIEKEVSVNDGKVENNSGDKKQEDSKKQDDTIANRILPQTGLSKIVVIGLVIVMLIVLILYIKYKSYKKM